jgi:hypothetical protein
MVIHYHIYRRLCFILHNYWQRSRFRRRSTAILCGNGVSGYRPDAMECGGTPGEVHCGFLF